jgi:hypothetical protein
MKFRTSISLFTALFMAVAGLSFAGPQSSANSASGEESVLTAGEVGQKLLLRKSSSAAR